MIVLIYQVHSGALQGSTPRYHPKDPPGVVLHLCGILVFPTAYLCIPIVSEIRTSSWQGIPRMGFGSIRDHISVHELLWVSSISRTHCVYHLFLKSLLWEKRKPVESVSMWGYKWPFRGRKLIQTLNYANSFAFMLYGWDAGKKFCLRSNITYLHLANTVCFVVAKVWSVVFWQTLTFWTQLVIRQIRDTSPSLLQVFYSVMWLALLSSLPSVGALEGGEQLFCAVGLR